MKFLKLLKAKEKLKYFQSKSEEERRVSFKPLRPRQLSFPPPTLNTQLPFKLEEEEDDEEKEEITAVVNGHAETE